MRIKHSLLALVAVSSLFLVACGSTKVTDATDDTEETDKKEDISDTNPTENTKETEPEKNFSGENAKLLEKVEQARKRAIDADAPKYYRALFDEASKKHDDLKSKVAHDKSTNYSSELNDLIKLYDSLANASIAQMLKSKVNELNPADVDAAVLKKGEDALKAYESLGTDGSASDLYDQAKIALDSYKKLVEKGFVAMAGRERKAALEAKKNAESVKAQVAKKTKESYKKASSTFVNADRAYSSKNIEGAYAGYKTAKESFSEMYEIVKKDREETEARLAAAREKVAAAEKIAAEADSAAPLTEKIAGIEDENAVLLQADSFANPEDSISDVESGADAKTAEKIADEAIASEEAKTQAVIDAK